MDTDATISSDAVRELIATDLKLLRSLPAYHGWIIDAIRPHLGMRLLEIGSGIGTYSRFFLGCETLILSEIDDEFLSSLREQFGEHSNVIIRRLDLDQIEDADIASLQALGLDTIICLNVLEHIEDDARALTRLGTCLAPGGRVAIVVPSHGWLYARLDRLYGHFRRYDSADATRLKTASGLRLRANHTFNLAGALAWGLNHRLRGHTELSRGQSRLFNALIPLLRRLDILSGWRIGLSRVMVFEKEATHG